MLGWIAIFIHFAAPVADDFLFWLRPFTGWIRVATLIVAGTFFLLSVSEVFAKTQRRIAFAFAISGASLLYLTSMAFHVSYPWFYAGLLLASNVYAAIQALQFYGWKSAYLYSLWLLLPYGGWTIYQAVHGHPSDGLNFYLFGFFFVTGLVYFRHFRKFTPGVICTSVSFLAWGCVFPVGAILAAQHAGPGPESFFWNLPKFFVAFGMILTLFETQAEVATVMARQYQVLFENNLTAVYVSTFEGKLLQCNGAFLKMYGFESKEEAFAQSTVSLYSHAAERELFLIDLGRRGQVLDYECTQRKKDGTLFWILERATVVPGTDGQCFIEGTSIDITERKQAEIALKQSEERFATIFRQSPMGCAILSLEGVFLDVNENMLRVLALPAEKVIGKKGIALGLWKSQQLRDDFYHKLRAEGSVQNLEVDFKDAAGNRHTGFYFAAIVRIDGKECIFGMMLDQTEERELEAKFLQAQKMEAVGRLAGGVAHDFNNLLGVIGGYAELLEAKLDGNENFRRYCTKIIDTTQRASGLTQQLLTFSRKEIIRPLPLQPDQAIREMAGILARLIGEDIELSVNLRARGTVVIDKTHFEQIIFNIAINARDAMSGGGQIFIETEDILRPVLTSSGKVIIGQYIAIRIRDTGLGMDEETRLHAFEPFYTTKEMGRGTGLGLATVYGIVHQCLGEISIESQLRKGTQITILLPTIGDVGPATNKGPDVEVKRGAGTILLVEDEVELRGANAEYLTSLGYSVLCAGSGPEALMLAHEAGQIDLVISDVVMPKMNGREFADRLLKLRPSAKLLFVSGYAADVVLQTGISSQGVPFLQKPYSLKQLGSKVNALLSVLA
jgi:PAS domain S-box-containing protein